MRCWAWNLKCPKCGKVGMQPKWSGAKVEVRGAYAEYIQYGFEAVCQECWYVEPVLPLDAVDEEAE